MSETLINQIHEGHIKAKGSGIGIRNINGRILNLYGSSFGINFESVLGQGTTVRINLPYHYDHIEG